MGLPVYAVLRQGGRTKAPKNKFVSKGSTYHLKKPLTLPCGGKKANKLPPPSFFAFYSKVLSLSTAIGMCVKYASSWLMKKSSFICGF